MFSSSSSGFKLWSGFFGHFCFRWWTNEWVKFVKHIFFKQIFFVIWFSLASLEFQTNCANSAKSYDETKACSNLHPKKLMSWVLPSAFIGGKSCINTVETFQPALCCFHLVLSLKFYQWSRLKFDVLIQNHMLGAVQCNSRWVTCSVSHLTASHFSFWKSHNKVQALNIDLQFCLCRLFAIFADLGTIFHECTYHMLFRVLKHD